MTTAIQNQGGAAMDPAAIEKVLLGGDLKDLTIPQRVAYYKSVCDSLGLNPLTKPFDFLTLNGKLVLYARRDCAEQLRKNNSITTKITGREMVSGVYVVTALARDPSGREDESTGAVFADGLRGEALANAMMKAETKAKRRVTLSICGLGILDETEVDSIPGARVHVEETPPAKQPKSMTTPAKPANPFDPTEDELDTATRDGEAFWATVKASGIAWKTFVAMLNAEFGTNYTASEAVSDEHGRWAARKALVAIKMKSAASLPAPTAQDEPGAYEPADAEVLP